MMANMKSLAYEQAEKIYETLNRQPFADWYGDASDFDVESPFGDHLGHHDGAPTKDEILNDIIRLFHLPL